MEVKLDTLLLNNPIMPASGPIVGDAEKMIYLMEQGVGAVVSKTISIKGACVPRPCIYGDKRFVMNSELWSEYPLEKWVEDFLPRFVKYRNETKRKTPLIISVGYTKDDMKVLLPALEPFADAFEVSTHYVGKDLSAIGDIVKTIRIFTDKPVFMKISPHIPDPVAFTRAVIEAGATGIVAINSLGPTMKIDLDRRRIVYGNDKGNVWMSGPVIKPVALAIIYQIRQAFSDIPIIGVGGIESAEDVLEFMMAGATAVQLLSAAMLKGKEIYKHIIYDLPLALARHRFDTLEDVCNVGLLPQADFRVKLSQVDLAKCTSCRLCERICPYFAISFLDQILINEEKCFGCGLCVSKCPVKALSLK